MPLIDDDGNLFGAVNVIDALVVVVLLAVIVGGIAVFATLGSGGEPETRYATIELGEQPDYVVDRVDEGDVATFEGSDDTITVTDVQVIPPSVGGENTTQADVTVRAEVDGELVEGDEESRDQFQVAGNPFGLGGEVQLETEEYTTTGAVTDLESDGASLSDEETAANTTAEVELENVPPAVADGLEEGMTETISGESVATVESVETESAAVVLESEDGNIYEREHPENEDVTLVVELRTTETESGVEFRGERLGVGESIVFDFDTMTVDGEVTALE